MNSGILTAVCAYLLWGFFPIYWKLLADIPSIQVVGHRVVWSLALLLAILLATGRLSKLYQAARQPKVLHTYLIAAVFIGANWLIYIWAVNAGFIIETSLGYFINPLVNVMLGVLILKERIRPWQWLPVGLAAAGVIYLAFGYGQLPWISLVLAGTFAIYALVKKTAPLGAVFGLTLETSFLFLPALAWLLYSGANGGSIFTSRTIANNLLLVGTGVVTAAPLLLFASAAKRVPLSVIGLLQYIAPTIQFLLGVFIYHEHFAPQKLLGYSLVWLGLAAFWLEGWLMRRKSQIAAIKIQG
jgi:chloramphenicol-sensitive protein RarD